MDTSLLEKKSFLKHEKKDSDLAWEHPFILKDIFKTCEVCYQGQVSRPETLFSEYELTHINLIYAGMLFRLQKKMQQSLPSQLILFKDNQQTFGELSLDFAYGLELKELHEFIQQELQTIRRNYPFFMGSPRFRWRTNPTLKRKQLSFELRI